MNKFDSFLGNWIQVVDNQNNITIEDFSYATYVIREKTGNHCEKCVSVNMCWFKDEKGGI